MAEMWSDLLNFLKEGTNKANPLLISLSEKIGEFTKVNPENIHYGIIFALALWLAYLISGKRLGLGVIGFAILIFIGLKYIGL